MFSQDAAAIPALGMEEIPKQLAKELPEGSILCQAEVVEIEGNTVRLATGESFSAPAILLATESNSLTARYGRESNRGWRSVTNVYFSAPQAPYRKPLLALNTAKASYQNQVRLVSNFVVMTNVAPQYAPQGQHLISVSINDLYEETDTDLIDKIKDELKTWYPNQVNTWQHLRTYTIKQALPSQQTVCNHLAPEQIRLSEGLYIAGDHLLNSSINAAMKAGRLAAATIGDDLEK
jgi:phytoene dehydrogenase-like protein